MDGYHRLKKRQKSGVHMLVMAAVVLVSTDPLFKVLMPARGMLPAVLMLVLAFAGPVLLILGIYRFVAGRNDRD